MTTNGQLNDTRDYHIKTNQLHVQHDSGFRLIGPCSSGRGKYFDFSVESNFNYCGNFLSMKNIWINIRTKKCMPKSVLRWEFASVYISQVGVVLDS